MLNLLTSLCASNISGKFSELFANSEEISSCIDVSDVVRCESNNYGQTFELYTADNSVKYSCSCTEIFGKKILTDARNRNRENEYYFDYDKWYSILRIDESTTESFDVVAAYAHVKIDRIKENSMMKEEYKKPYIDGIQNVVILYDKSYITLDEAMEKIAKI